jgi:hypothetical protein
MSCRAKSGRSRRVDKVLLARDWIKGAVAQSAVDDDQIWRSGTRVQRVELATTSLLSLEINRGGI